MREAKTNLGRVVRGGTTLIEVLGTLSVLLAIAIAGGSMLGSVTSLGLQCKLAEQSRVDIARLATMLRSDVHAAMMGELNEDGQSLDLTLEDQDIRYQIDAPAHRILRKQTDSEGRSSIEQFSMTARCQPEFGVQDDLVTLRLTAGNARHPWVIEAVRP